METRQHVAERITARIIEALEAAKAGGEKILPWRKTWTTAPGSGRVPVSLAGRRYNGVNRLVLAIEAMEKGYVDQRWGTFNQIKAMGGHVKRGEKGTTVVLWKRTQFTKQNEAGEDETRAGFVARAFVVFNVAQTEGLPAPAAPDGSAVTVTPDDDAVLAIVRAAGARVEHGSTDGAFYSPSGDYIAMPAAGSFDDRHSYRAVLLHEATHWTGHKSRLDRDFQRRFSTNERAMEELVAELGAAFMCAELGLDGAARHEGYIDHWLTVMRGDKFAIITAARKAEDAADYVMTKGGARKAAVETSGDEETETAEAA